MAKQTVALEVVELCNQQVVHTVDVKGKYERAIEMILRGMLRNMDTDKFCVREVKK